MGRTDFNLTVASRILGIDGGTFRRLARGYAIDLSRTHPGRRPK